MDKVLVNCWFCGKKYLIELGNYYAGDLFCSDECRIDNLKSEIEIEKKGGEKSETVFRSESGKDKSKKK